MHGDYLDRLARLARRVRFDDLSDSTVAATKAVVLDTLGAILAGSRLAAWLRDALCLTAVVCVAPQLSD